MLEQQQSKDGDFNDLLIMAACAFWVDLSRQSHMYCVAAVRYEPPNVAAENVSVTGGEMRNVTPEGTNKVKSLTNNNKCT